MKPCGAPSISTSELSAIVSCERLPLTPNGTIALEAPRMISVGTSTLARSPRKSVYENAAMQSSVALGEENPAISRW